MNSNQRCRFVSSEELRTMQNSFKNNTEDESEKLDIGILLNLFNCYVFDPCLVFMGNFTILETENGGNVHAQPVVKFVYERQEQVNERREEQQETVELEKEEIKEVYLRGSCKSII